MVEDKRILFGFFGKDDPRKKRKINPFTESTPDAPHPPVIIKFKDKLSKYYFPFEN